MNRFIRVTSARIVTLAALTFVSLALPLCASQADSFVQNVAPFVEKNCAMCHNDKAKVAGLSLTQYRDLASFVHDRDVWERVANRVRSGEMPPKGIPKPDPAKAADFVQWIDNQFDEIDRTTSPDPGHLTAHRLNRVEYNNTVRDLLAVKFKPAADFPADDSGFGFDNIGDALSVSPVLMEKYLAAAKKVAAQAIPIGLTIPKPTRMHFSPDHLVNEARPSLDNTFDFPADGDYEFHASVGGRQAAFQIQMLLDGKEIFAGPVVVKKDTPRTYEIKLHAPYGQHSFEAILTPREATAEETATLEEIKASEEKALAKAIARNPADEKQIRLQHTLGNSPVFMDSLELRGPFNASAPPLPESYKSIFLCGHAPGHHTSQCARQNIANLASRAFRRPASSAEVTKLTRLLALGEKSGLTDEQSMRLAVAAILVSPHFLYRLQHDPNPKNIADVHPIGDYEMASRLSYFLWSSMPDAELLQAAAAKRLTKPDVVHEQVRRMLRDPKASALADNFFGQWLELRNLDSIHPDPTQFPEFDNRLRHSMYTETRMFTGSIIQEDRSILDFIDGKYTFLDGRLAKFYGIPGVEGDQFRRVELDGTERSGVLTQASILAITSYPTRTSPVLRGKWILENILNTPPPPPPPGVGSLDEKGGPLSGTMRQQMEKHRANPTCAACHTRMDPLGFSLENYDAIGHWRTVDANQPIDSKGVLPNGKSFQGSAEMKEILAGNRDSFAECVTEKMLIYGLGRGLEGYDRSAVKKIVAALKANDYKFSTLVNGVVDSAPFQLGRADGGATE